MLHLYRKPSARSIDELVSLAARAWSVPEHEVTMGYGIDFWTDAPRDEKNRLPVKVEISGWDSGSERWYTLASAGYSCQVLVNKMIRDFSNSL